MSRITTALPCHRFAFCLLVLGLAFVTTLSAQFETSLTVNKDTYITYEGLEATVTITNRSGADVVMGGPNDLPWLSFEITNPAGQPVQPLSMRAEQSLVLKSGATISRKVALSEHFSFSDYGTYGITANVYHPPSQQYFTSNRARANFTDAKKFWSKNFGVPIGQANAGQIRRYELCVLRDLEHTNLYVRLIDEKTELKIATFSLGHCIMVADPQVTLDRDNNMHALFMAAPHIYAHVTVNTQGRVSKREYHREILSNRPQLTSLAADQTITVQGGEPYDPTAAPVDAKPQGRSVRQRPPGL